MYQSVILLVSLMMNRLKKWTQPSVSMKYILAISCLVFCVYSLRYLTYLMQWKSDSMSGDVDILKPDNRIKRTQTILVQALVRDKAREHRKMVLKEFSGDYEELFSRETVNRPVHKYGVEQIYFAFTSNTKRIRDIIHLVRFWATIPGIRCLMLFEQKDFLSRSSIKEYFTGEGISCKIQTSTITHYEARYLELIQQALQKSNTDSYTHTKKIQWFAFGDDDTVWFFNNLLQTLQQYNASDLVYLGDISDRVASVRRHGTYFAYGGGGIVLSRPLALQVAQHMKECQRFSHMFGGDEMIGKCITEVLKVNLTRNKHFHQMDHYGDMDGYLESGIEGLVSLHHIFSLWEPFPEEHTASNHETMHLLRLAYQTFGHKFLKRYVRVNHKTNQTFLLTMGYSFSLFDRVLKTEELMKVEKTWCCSEFVARKMRPKENNKVTWYFRAVTNETVREVVECGVVYEYKRKDIMVRFPKIEITLTN